MALPAPRYVSPATHFVKRPRYGMMGAPRAPRSPVPHATGGKPQPDSGPRRRYGPGGAAAPATPAKPPANPDAALIAAATKLRFGPQEQAVQTGLAQNTRYTAGLGDWYGQALQEIAALRGQGQQQSAATLGRIQSYGSQPALGNERDQQAALARNSLNSEYGAMFARDANANDAAMARIAAATSTQEGNTRNQANADRQRLLAGLATLKGQEGDFKTTYGAQLAGQRATTQLAQSRNDIAAKALGIKVDTLNKVQIPLAKSLATDRTAGQKVARTNARTRQTTETNRQTQRSVDNAFKKNDLALKAYKLEHPNAGKKAGGNSRYSPTKIQGFRDQFSNAVATAQQAKKHAKGGTSADEVYTAMLGHFDADVAKAAAQIAFGKPVDRDLRHRLAVKGVHPKSGTRTIAGAVQAFLQGLGG